MHAEGFAGMAGGTEHTGATAMPPPQQAPPAVQRSEQNRFPATLMQQIRLQPTIQVEQHEAAMVGHQHPPLCVHLLQAPKV